MKPWYLSRTIVVNLISAILISLETTFPTLKPFIGDVWYGILFTLLCIVNVILRFDTTQPVGARSQSATGDKQQSGIDAGTGE